MKKWFQNLNAKNTELVDEHSQPTEPLPPLDPLAPLVLPATPLYPTSPSNIDVLVNTPTLPTGQPAIPVAVPPDPYDATASTASGAQWQAYQPYPSSSPSYATATPAQVYPYPPVPSQQAQQPHEPTWLQPKVGQQLTPVARSISSMSRALPVPLLVGLCFVAIQLILVARLVVLFIPNSTMYTWSATIIAFGDLCAEPFFALIQQAALPSPVNTAVATLMAIIAYGIISRMLVRLLKLLLRRRAQTV